MNRSAVAILFGIVATAAASVLAASDLSGRVVFNGLAVPGATVTATRPSTFTSADSGRAKENPGVSTVSDDDGVFHFANLDDGPWTLRVEMLGFVTASRDVTVPQTGTPLSVTLALRTFEDIAGQAAAAVSASSETSKPALAIDAAVKVEDDPNVINGSVINGAASVFAQPRAFGNNRPRPAALYTGGVSAILGSSAWNARPFSFGGSVVPTPSYGDAQFGVTLGGPLKIPWLVKNGPQVFFALQHGDLHNATTQSALMPTAAERAGDFSTSSVLLRDPATGLPFSGNVIPSDRISPQAAALLAYYPMPNSAASRTGANYQTAVVTATKQDSLQLTTSQSLSSRTSLGGTFAFQRAVTDSVSLFDFADSSRQSSLNGVVNWSRRFNQRLLLRLKYQFTRAVTSTTPFFASRTNVSANAGIAGNNQDPANWGPPALAFPDIAGLRDVDAQHSVSLTHGVGAEASLKRGRHNITMGGDARRDAVDVASQPDPRGTLSFTGAATGSAFADFLLGLPTTSAIAFSDATARIRGTALDAYISDDFRVSAGLTFNLGVRWEYEAPFTELAGRLVNLDVAPNFAAASPVLATSPVGSLTGSSYPASLLRPDKRSFEPRVSTSWRPMLGSSLVIRGSYGLYRNLGVYQPIALLLTQQPPLSTTFSVQSSAATPLTLANPFPVPLSTASNTFAIDPNFRPGYAHAWQLSLQRDLPASLTLLVTYDGAKGSHLMQAFLPNTYPAGAVNACVACPSGFVYVTSNGSSLRNAGQFTLRRRLHNGLTASVQYTLSKSTDDAATFSNTAVTPASLAIAQNWLDLGAERGPSSYDRRHLVSVQFQYTSGVGVGGGTLVDSRWGTLFKDWTITSQLNAGSGLPFTPISFIAVAGTGVVGVRPTLTGASTAPSTPGAYADADAFAAPAPGTWGDAGRNSIRGPREFSLDMSVARVFRLRGRVNLEWRVAATNVLNRVTFATIGTVIGSPQFGLPTLANSMRRLQTTFRLRF